MLIPSQCRHVLARLGYYYDEDIAFTFESEARDYAGSGGKVLVLPKKCSVMYCGCRPRSGEVLRLTATKHPSDDVDKDGKRLIYDGYDGTVYIHVGAASETLYVYLPGDPGPWVFCSAYRQADQVNLAQMILVIDTTMTTRRRRRAV